MNTSHLKAEKTNTCALILAGGQSRRMNLIDKGLIRWKNKPLIEHVIESIKKQLDHIIINANQHHDQYQQLNYPVIPDSIDGFLGPLSGILSVMQYCKNADYILVLPCDCPTPATGLFERLATALNKNPSAQIAIADDGQRQQPLFGLYKSQLLPDLEKALRKGDYKVMQFVKNNHSITVDFSDQAESFKNFNRPEDLQINE